MRSINSSTSPSHSFLTAGAALTAGAGLLALASAACSSSSDSSGTGISGSSGSGNSGSAGSGAVSFGGSGGASTGGSGFGGVGGGGKGGSGTGGSGTGGISGSGFGGTGGISTGGSGGIVGTGGTGGTGSTAPPCLTNPSVQGVIIGDSYVTGFFTPPFQPELVKLDATAQQFRNYAVAGTSMGSGGLGLIPPQFDQAVAAGSDIKFVIMDGGGNDVLICDTIKYPGCNTLCLATGSSTQSVCQAIVNDALTASTNLMTKMANAGVRDVIYFFYPHIPPGATSPNPNEILDYAYTLAGPACDSALSRTGGKLACHFVDLRQPFADNGGYSNISTDGIHPTLSGQDIIAAQVWNVMQRDCVGMTGGCCTP